MWLSTHKGYQKRKYDDILHLIVNIVSCLLTTFYIYIEYAYLFIRSLSLRYLSACFINSIFFYHDHKERVSFILLLGECLISGCCSLERTSDECLMCR